MNEGYIDRYIPTFRFSRAELSMLIHDAQVDRHLPELSDPELRVLVAVLIKQCKASIEQLQQMTGLARSSVRDGLQELIKRGLLDSYPCPIPHPIPYPTPHPTPAPTS